MRCAVPFALACLAIVGLGACGDKTVAERLGMAKRAPDEFAVVRRAPLVMPPDARLRPPTPGQPRPYQRTTGAEARATLTGGQIEDPSADQASSGEVALLGAAGATEADPEIRRVVDQETETQVSLDESIYLWMFDWQRERFRERDYDVIDPAEEQQRLRNQQQAKARAEAGQGPTVVRLRQIPLGLPETSS
jgi:hypothetical protein